MKVNVRMLWYASQRSNATRAHTTAVPGPWRIRERKRFPKSECRGRDFVIKVMDIGALLIGGDLSRVRGSEYIWL